MKSPIKVTKFAYSGSSEEESAAIRMRFPTKIPVSDNNNIGLIEIKTNLIIFFVFFYFS